MAERIGREEFEEKVLKSGLPVLVDFYSDSCMACKKLAPVLSQAEELLGESIYFYKVNTNYENELTEKYEILSRPTLIVFINGREAERKTGVQRLQEFIDWLKAF
ncbi:thioredoxin family protein [Hominisplanchenecus murintestinalis]|uniref:thioredoxin family protein n=1 Tax=Hominisplanchenecus murintestinalis TaxID=2941517 RepID=UPI0020413C11|nr:thioredoxin domain-containing protein [Hominisplanchenecus murintestinalis]